MKKENHNNNNNTKKPIIGILAKPLLKCQLTKTLWDRLVINKEFNSLVVNHGGIAIGIMSSIYFGHSDDSDVIEILSNEDIEDLTRVLSMVDGIILQGGLTSDTYEIEVVKYALKNDIPIIGVCAGFNNIARAVGVPVIKKEDLANKHNIYSSDISHNIKINQNHNLSCLFENNIVGVNSLHSMFVENKDLPTNIDVLATDFDGNVEAFTVKDTKFCMAIKWHPEIMSPSLETQNIFRYFINVCKKNN